jgi:hypothetical protein
VHLLGAPVLRARVLRERTRSLGAANSTGVFRREGDVWSLSYEGRSCRLRDAKGLRYLATLLASPGREILALELAQGDEPVTTGDAPAVLDAQAKASYRERLHGLAEELEQARGWNDPERAAAIEEEIDALTEELARATGLGGRDRRAPSAGERARVSVTKAIRSAIAAVTREHPELGAHLAASVHTGRFCSYAPPGEAPPAWHI